VHVPKGASLVLVSVATLVGLPKTASATGPPAVRVIPISYRAHDGLMRRADVIVPADYVPGTPIPLVISPHGRGVGAGLNVRRWGRLPALGDFAVVNPEGQGRALTLFSWGDPGEIRDLARMPDIVEEALPWRRVDRHRVYAFGGSMGGQETLLLVAHFPHLLAGAAAFDAPTNMAARYRAFVGQPRSTRDRVVTDQRDESGLLYRTIKRLNPSAPVREYVGTWAHTSEMKSGGYLPYALSRFRLLPPRAAPPPLTSPV
jgi:pimeloyl-ACP methyl ester carboxylesterase